MNAIEPRRRLLTQAGTAAISAGTGPALSQSMIEDNPLVLSRQLPSGTRAETVLDALPGKKPLIELAY